MASSLKITLGRGSWEKNNLSIKKYCFNVLYIYNENLLHRFYVHSLRPKKQASYGGISYETYASGMTTNLALTKAPS